MMYELHFRVEDDDVVIEALVAVPSAVSPATVDAAVQALIAGPSSEEAAGGLHSAVGPSTRVRRAVQEGGIARPLVAVRPGALGGPVVLWRSSSTR